MNAREIIKKEYGNGYNFMTPRVIRYGMISKIKAYELSTGEGFEHQPIWGVSIVNYNPDTKETERIVDESGCFQSLESAERHIINLK